MQHNTRRIERERVLSLLYEAEMKGEPVTEVIASQPVKPEEFVVETATGVGFDTNELDNAVNRHAIDWDIDRMASIDRNILRIGAWELLHQPELSVAVIISEAIELAKKFSTEDSGKFVNGILSALAEETRTSPN